MKKKSTIFLVLMLSIINIQTAFGQNNQWSATNKFKNCITSMQSTNDESARFNFAMNHFLTEHATTIQLQDACHFLSSDQNKYELGVAAYPNIIDKDHFYSIYDLFSKFSWAIKLYHNTQEKLQFTALETNYQLNLEKDNNAIYNLLIQKGDILLSNNQFDEALLIYQQAQEINPNDKLILDKITDVAIIKEEFNAILEAENIVNTDFDNYIHQGDMLLSSNNIDQAIAMYEAAMALKPGDELAYLRIKEANIWKSELSNIVEEENQKRTHYDFLLQKGDILVSSNKFDDAITIYTEASAIYPAEQSPYIKIEDANRLKQELINASSVCSTSEAEFRTIKKSIADKFFADEQMEMAKKHIHTKCFTIEQMKKIVRIFSMDDDKLEMIKYLYDYSYQQNRFYEFRSILTFNSTQKEFDDFLINKS
jgi:tetratricopeptide (TPR) repeat protein